jgi:hypothetical protein
MEMKKVRNNGAGKKCSKGGNGIEFLRNSVRKEWD